jgi:hypothetical protein
VYSFLCVDSVEGRNRPLVSDHDARGDTDRRNAPAVSRLVGFFGALVTTGSI